MKTSKGPFPGVAFNKLMAANANGPFYANVSGEVTVTVRGKPIAASLTGGRVSNVWLSVLASGKDDTNTLKVQADVKINGTSCLTTQPYIQHVSGEASQSKTTKITGDTGIQAAGMNTSANTVTAGDLLTCDLVVTRTSTPTTEMANLVLCVEMEPEIC